MDNKSLLPSGEVVTKGNYFSIPQLLALGLPGKPRTAKGWYGLVEREAWEFVEVDGQGGPRGIRREYIPPPDVQALIEAVQRGEIAPAAPLKKPANTPASNKAFNEMRVAERRVIERRIASLPKPPNDLDTLEGRLRFAEKSLELVNAGYSAEWLATGQGPMRTPPPPPPPKPHRLNMEAWKAILRGALKKTPNPDPDEFIEWCAGQYDFYMDNGMITEDGVGEGNLGAAA